MTILCKHLVDSVMLFMVFHLFIFRYGYDSNGRMVSVQFTTEMSDNRQIQAQKQYKYKNSTSQYPEKYILPSGNEFHFLRENKNEELIGVITPKQQNHMFRLLPLVGKTMLYYRPPWIDSEGNTYRLVFNDIETSYSGQTLFFPSGNSINTYNGNVLGCINRTDLVPLDRCYTIKGNKTDQLFELVSQYETEEEGKVGNVQRT